MSRFFFFFLALSCFTSLLAETGQKDIAAALKDKMIKKGIKFFKDEKLKSKVKKTKHLIVDLKNPIYKDGVLYTYDGGIIKGEDLRIQAQNIVYINKRTENGIIHKIEASKDFLMIRYGKVYTGSRLEYDFETKSGIIYNGKTYNYPWYLSGDLLTLKNDGSYKIENVSITTCENINSTWDIHAGRVQMDTNELLKAKNVRFRFYNIPTLAVPSLKINLKKYLSKPLLRYKFSWDKSTGPKVSIRYQVYSWRDLALFTRIDYRLNKGLGGAFETEYFPPNNLTTFTTKSYLARDMLPSDPKTKLRYRFQGAFRSTTSTGNSYAAITWDKYSDIHMPGDFKTDDFEINTGGRTELTIRHQQEEILAILHARPRVHSFETLKEDIPTFYVTMLPIQISPLNLIVRSWNKSSFQRIAYSDHLKSHLKDIQSGRFEIHNEIYRPFYLGGLKFTPLLGVAGIYYTNALEPYEMHGLGSIYYEAKLSMDFYRKFKKNLHTFKPYIDFMGTSKPTIQNSDHYIFSLADTFCEQNLFRIGIKNLVSSIQKQKAPSVSIDFYTNCFLEKKAMLKYLPKIYLDTIIQMPSTFLLFENGWDFEKKRLDHFNTRFGWTLSKDVAFALEFRYRSSYDFRKADKENYILDLSRNLDELEKTALSDRRCTFLTHGFLRLSPYWTCHLETHHGWNRKTEKPYNELKIDLFSYLSSSWTLKLTYLHTETDDRVSWSISLNKR